jgi:hypothetical protein
MDAIGRIAAMAAAAAGQGDLPPGLVLGRAVQARVQQMLADGVYRLLTPAGPLRLESATPLPVGATVTLTLAQTPEGPLIRLALQGVPPGPPGETRLASPLATLPVIARPAGPPVGSALPSTPADQLARTTSMPPEPSAPTVVSASVMNALGRPAVAPASPAAARASGAEPAAAHPAALTAVPQAAKPPSPAPRTPLAQAISDALKVQDGLVPLLARLQRAATGGAGRQPGVATAALRQLNALAFDLSAAPDGEELRQAIQRSGVLLETRLAAGEPPGPRGDLKAMLLGVQTAVPSPTGEPSETAAASARQPPPRRGAPPAPPPPAMAAGEIAPEAPLGELVRAALARLTLQQAASLPGAGEGTPAERAGPTLHATVPIALPGGLAVAELVVEPEPRAAGGAEAPDRAWRVWVALDAEPHGPVSALVSFGRQRGVGVTFWAERPGAAEALAADLDALRASLLAADLAVGELTARAGAPGDRAGAGLRLDRVS